MFGYWAVFGPNGLMHWRDYQDQLAARHAQLKQVQAERDRLRNRVNLLDPRGADPDMVDEMVRRKLDVAHPDEVIVPVK